MTTEASERMLDEAAHWMARMRSGHISEADAQAFQIWHDSHPKHAQIFRRMTDGIGLARRPELQRLDHEQVIAALDTPHSRRRVLRGMALLGGIGVSSLGLRLVSGQLWPTADLQTSTAERRTFDLPDGSRMTLNAQTHLSPVKDASRRSWHLHKGTLQLACYELPATVETPLCRFDAEPGSRALIERHDGGRVSLTVIARSVRITTRAGDTLSVEAGQSVQLSPALAPVLDVAPPDAGAWLDGLIEARNQPLGELIDALRAYRRGVIRISPEAAGLRISGRFPLDDTAKALRLIAASLPVTMTLYGELWTRIELAAHA